MTYDFEKGIDRKNTNCIKWDYNDIIFGEKDVLSMWVADMDLPSPQPVIDADIPWAFTQRDPDFCSGPGHGTEPDGKMKHAG